MKSSLTGILILIAGSLTGCATLGYTIDEDKLTKTASFDHGCSKEKISIQSQEDESGTGRYLLVVCGKQRKYIRLGTAYFEQGKEPKL